MSGPSATTATAAHARGSRVLMSTTCVAMHAAISA